MSIKNHKDAEATQSKVEYPRRPQHFL